MMSSPKAVQELGKDHNRKPVGTGPYTIVSWVDGDKIVLKRNEKYWRPGRPYLDGHRDQVITEIGTAVRSVLAGDNNYVYFMSPQQKPLVDRAKNLTVVSAPTVYCLLIYFNFIAARRSMTSASARRSTTPSNREDFVKLTLGGVGRDGKDAAAEVALGFRPETAAMYPYDPDKAKKLLAEAGYKDGLDTARWSATPTRRYLRRQDVLIEQMTQGRHQTALHQRHHHRQACSSPSRKATVCLRPWTGRPDPSLSYSLMFLKDAYYNPGRVEVSTELTEAINASRISESIEERSKAFRHESSG